MTDYLAYSPSELSNKIYSGEFSPVNVVDAYIDRIKRVNPKLNAVVVDNFESARRKAQELENQIDEIEDPPPLLGVPFTIKEMISVEGKTITCGSRKRSDAQSTKHADVVQHLLDAGAIPLGLTNVPELGLWIETYNKVYGQTNNPHDTSRTPGGSSGGEASIVAAGGSSFGVGSDVGGSIRIPSSFCGVYGHKSSTDRVSQTGHFPHEHSDQGFESIPNRDMISLGPITRHASDLKLLFELFYSGKTTLHRNAGSTDPRDFSEMTIYVLPDPEIQFASSTSQSQREAIEQTADVFQQLGSTIKTLPNDKFYRAPDMYTSFIDREGLPSMERMAGSGEPINTFIELIKKTFNLSDHTMPILMVCLMDDYLMQIMKAFSSGSSPGSSLRNDLIETLGPDGILLMPPFPTSAPEHGQTLSRPMDLLYSAVFNALDLPVTTAPVGSNDAGLPTGVQLVVAPGNDQLSLDAAVHLERTLGKPEPQSP